MLRQNNEATEQKLQFCETDNETQWLKKVFSFLILKQWNNALTDSTD